MKPAKSAGHIHFIRFILVAFLLPGLPAISFYFCYLIGFSNLISFLIALLTLLLWAWICRLLLVKWNYRCPNCGLKCAQVKPDENTNLNTAYLICDSCGYKERTGYKYGED